LFFIGLIPEGGSHPREPVLSSLRLVAGFTTGHKIVGVGAAAKTARTNMVESKFINVIRFSAIDTLTAKVFFNGSSPEPFSFRRCHRY
jgi:hypothetical protein